jgi:negative regulator of genetic competence, sporulation and motility
MHGATIKIKMDLHEVEWRDLDWIDLAQNMDKWRAFLYAVMNLRVP